MRKRSQNMQNRGGKPKAQPGTRALALVAAFALVMSMCPGAAALAFAGEQLSAGAADMRAQADDPIPVTADTHSMSSGTYKVAGDVTIEPDGKTGNGIQIAKGAKVLLYIEKGATLTVTGKAAEKKGVGRAAILLPEGATLTVAGEGTLNATGGKAAAGSNGGKARRSATLEERHNQMSMLIGILYAESGNGGKGGNGGGGAGAGIGTDGGSGGAGGTGGKYSTGTIKIREFGSDVGNTYGYVGEKGSQGSVAQPAGTLIVTDKVAVNAKGGAAGKGGKAGKRGIYVCACMRDTIASAGTSGGGGGGGGGSAADGIGSGGTGGGGGGGGASANVTSRIATYRETRIDDLWSHGGFGGSSTWGGKNGANGDEGAVEARYDTDASKKYAKNGGEGGSCVEPAPVAFYTYKDSDSSDPKCTSTSGNDVTRDATFLGTLEDFVNLGGYTVDVAGGTHTYDGKPHGVSVNTDKLKTQSDGAGALGAQAEGDPGVSYSVAYYGTDGKELGSEPVMPGLYAAVVSFTGEGISGSWIEPVSIGKRQVAKPTPAELQFQCANWATGDGLEQDAFPALDETDYTFVPNAKAADGSASLKSAKAAGNYQACFKLKDPSTCRWEGESEDSAEAWVPWSIELALFDPNDPQVTYWGTAYNNATITVDYTGEPIWVRPWWTPAKATDGRFPEWFTHWGGEGRPTTDRRSACVMYFKGQDDHEGLVGYHENADGSLEPVTGDQVYAWMFGVDVGDEHVAVEAGDKVWYKTGEDGWKVPLAVEGGKSGLSTQAARPEGAEGYVVARDCAYATHLGVMEPGTYHAYAYFDAGAGFAPTALAESAVEVKAAGGTKAAAAPKTGAGTKTSASSTPKTGDFSPFVVGGIALVGLIAAGVIALSLARRRR